MPETSVQNGTAAPEETETAAGTEPVEVGSPTSYHTLLTELKVERQRASELEIECGALSLRAASANASAGAAWDEVRQSRLSLMDSRRKVAGLKARVTALEASFGELDIRYTRLAMAMAENQDGLAAVQDYLSERIQFTHGNNGPEIPTQDITVDDLCQYNVIPTHVEGCKPIPGCTRDLGEYWSATLTSYDGLTGTYQIIGGIV